MRRHLRPRDSWGVKSAPAIGQIAVRYLYVWTPLLIIGTAVLLPRLWLAAIALMLVALVLLVTLAALAYALAWTWRVLSDQFR